MNEARKCISRRLPPAQEFLNSAIALCRSFDVNFDNNFNILDASLVLSNYRTLELEGQAP